MDLDFLNQIKKDIIKAVFTDETVRLKAALDVIQDRHGLRTGCRAFLLDGNVIWNGDAVAAKVKKKQPLALEDQPEARQLVLLQGRLLMDQQRIANFFGTLTHRCHEAQDFRDVLPDMVVEHMETPEIKGLSRTRNQGYIFSSSPTKMKHYQDGVDIMLRYLVNKLVF